MSPTIALRMGARDWAILLFLSVLWGGSFFFIDVAVDSVNPLTLVLVRVTIAAAILLAVLKATGRPLPFARATSIPFLVLALLNNAIPFTLFAWGQQHIASGLASILNATTPLWAVLVTHFLTADEKATPLKVAGVAVGFAGVAVMIGGDLLLDISGENLLAQLACLGATLCYALAGVHARRFRAMGVPPMTVSAGQLLACALVMLPMVLLFEPPWRATAPEPGAMLAILGLAVFSTALAYILYFRLIETAGATNAILVTFLIPATAILLGATLLGESLAPRHFGGLALIVFGLAAIDGRVFARSRPPTPA
ncbi:DMT family transporter [Sphingosinicella sp. CPCC 101087]|uniref:DMT family transporter n=1 Tax=Sphingosinicella sp. CPCC 101087 TaxID=2497754 RepID=UPI00197D34BF|nr:EamA family transporter [Sphingosinicella sp. CPCC 101087]